MATGTIPKGTIEKTTTITYTKSDSDLTLTFNRVGNVVYVTANTNATMNLAKSWTKIADSIAEEFIPNYISIAGVSTLGGSCGLVVPDTDHSIQNGSSSYYPRGCVLFYGTASSAWLQGSGFYLINQS